MVTTNQEGKQSSFRSVTGGINEYNGDFIAMAESEGAIGVTFNEIMISWLQIRTGSAETDIDDLKQIFAESLGFYNWESINLIPPLPESGFLLLETGDSLLLETGDKILL